MYRKRVENFSKKYDTWIIGYCPDIDAFFAVPLRGFYWESYIEFQTEEAAVNFFESNIVYFNTVKNHIQKDMNPLHEQEDAVWLDNTEKWYYV